MAASLLPSLFVNIEPDDGGNILDAHKQQKLYPRVGGVEGDFRDEVSAGADLTLSALTDASQLSRISFKLANLLFFCTHHTMLSC